MMRLSKFAVCTKAPNGFTLVEMCVAVALFAIVGLGLFSVFNAGLKLNAKTQAYLEASGDAMTALEKMAVEMENMIAYDFSGSYPQKKSFQMNANTVEFLIMKSDGIKAVRYQLQSPLKDRVKTTEIGIVTTKNVSVKEETSITESTLQLIRQERDFIDFLTDNLDSARTQILSSLVAPGGLTYQFASMRNNDLEWDSLPPQRNLPLGIKIELQLSPQGSTGVRYRFAKEILIPVGGMGF